MQLVPAPDARLLLCTAPPGEAHDLARRLVESGLAACVNVVPGLRSVYRWEGRVHDEPESLLLVKTTPACLPALARWLGEQHPYEVPEALVLAPGAGSEAYLAWLSGAVGDPGPAGR
ncbi:MAG: divalent-cation tolerance protein CutA [Planctomycetia bacterium]